MLDLKDLKLIYELQWNARQTYSELAKKIKLSKQATRYRIENLEKNEIIKSYHALIDWRALGFNAIRIYLQWQNITPEKEKEIYEHIKKNNLFMWSVKFEGEVDIAFYVWIKSIPEFSKEWFNFLEKYGEYILRQEIYESVNMHHYPYKVLIKDKIITEKIVGIIENQEFDDIDYKILKELTKNARDSIINISSRINLTPKAILYRIKQLEKKKILLGYNAIIDTNKIGYKSYKIDFFLRNYKQIKEMEEFAKTHKNIIYRMRTIGGPDVEIELIVKTVDEMKKILNEIRKQFSESINHHRIYRFEYTIKQIYLPGEKNK